MVEVVRQCGAVGRETRELEEVRLLLLLLLLLQVVRAEEAEGRGSRAEQLSKDLRVLQAENKAMAKKYHGLVK